MISLIRRILIRITIPLSWLRSRRRIAASLSRFAEIEADSGWQMLHALERTTSPERRRDLFENALEEREHAARFRRLAEAYATGPLPLPKFRRTELLEGADDLAFSAAHHVGEREIYDQFRSYAAAAGRKPIERLFLEIRQEEEGHGIEAWNRLVAIAGSENDARSAVRRARRARVQDSFARASQRIGDILASVLLTATYCLFAPWTAPLCRRRIAEPERTAAERADQAPAKAPDAPSPKALQTTVFVTGAAVMMLEILGTRIIGPFYGVGMFVWSSLISVALISLAAGYRFGGVLADRGSSDHLPRIVALAALFTALIPHFRPWVLELTDPLGLRLGAFTSTLLLFSVPITLLGMTNPYVTKRCLREADRFGRTAGSILAIGTLGSVVGTLATGFWLLPAFGTPSILYGLSGALLTLSLFLGAGSLQTARRWRPYAEIAGVGFLALFIGTQETLATAKDPVERFVVRQDTESLYGKLRVVDDRRHGIRWLLADSSSIGGIYRATGQPVPPYLRLLEVLPFLQPKARDALVIGLGAGSLPQALERRGVRTDSIEIDPAVAAAAAHLFDFESRGRLIVGDARYEIRRIRKRYDFIVHDCFTGGEMPSHLFSVEMIRELRALLREDGIFAMNFFGFSDPGRAEAIQAVSRTVAEVFPFVSVHVSLPDTQPSDHVFFASNAPLDFSAPSLKKLNLRNRRALAELPRLRTTIPIDGIEPITDDFNPLEWLQVRKADAYRTNQLIPVFGISFLLQ